MNHKRSFDKLKTAYKKYKEKTWLLYNTLIEQCRHYYTAFVELVVNPQADTKKRYRMVLLAVSILCIIDYAAISVLTDKNIFDIYPSLPALDTRETIDIFVADLDAKSILKETRQVLLPQNNESKVRRLVKLVAEGSEFENTRAIAPIDIVVRHVWFYDTTCIIDCELGTIEGQVPYIPDSFKAFNKALEQTISRNIPGITRVVLLEHGIYGKNLW
ncbi:MAG TPA: hypothetical protein PLO73_08620 [Spirochaetota bacterium]|nr:hypothetical protein [Spirochaetota bacterium]